MKRKLAWLLMLCTMLSMLGSTAYAASSDFETEVLPVLAVMGILNGDEYGNLNLDVPVTRAQFVKMAISASAYKNRGQTPSAVSPYPDVRAGAWHSGYITTARDMGLITGYLDGTFRPDNTITLEETVSVMLKVMGYSGTDFAAGFPSAHLSLYHALGLDADMTAKQGSPMRRRDCALLVYNCLNAKAKSGMVYASQLGYSLDSRGRINYAALTTALTEGPVRMENSLEAAVGFVPVSVFRDRSVSDAGHIAYGDVLYYNKDIRTVWAYSKKVSGIVQAISPSTLSPSAVTVSGMTCALGSSQVIHSFSDLGTIKVGDSITLLLGAGEQAVFVLTGQEASQTLYGVVTSVAPAVQSGSLGTVTQQPMLTMIAADGSTRSYAYDGDDLKTGDIAKVTLSGGGVTIREARNSQTLSGKVRNGKLDGCLLDGDTRILDVLGGRAVTVTPQRLEGMNLRAGDILFALTEDDHAEVLILDNVTGDARDYGILTAAFESPDLFKVNSSYVVTVAGMPKTLSAAASYGIENGPVGIEYKADGSLRRLVALQKSEVEVMGAFDAELKDGEALPLAADLQVYLKQDNSYYLSSRLSVSADTHKLIAYYDAAPEAGGRIRILIVE